MKLFPAAPMLPERGMRGQSRGRARSAPTGSGAGESPKPAGARLPPGRYPGTPASPAAPGATATRSHRNLTGEEGALGLGRAAARPRVVPVPAGGFDPVRSWERCGEGSAVTLGLITKIEMLGMGEQASSQGSAAAGSSGGERRGECGKDRGAACPVSTGSR